MESEQGDVQQQPNEREMGRKMDKDRPAAVMMGRTEVETVDAGRRWSET